VGRGKKVSDDEAIVVGEHREEFSLVAAKELYVG